MSGERLEWRGHAAIATPHLQVHSSSSGDSSDTSADAREFVLGSDHCHHGHCHEREHELFHNDGGRGSGTAASQADAGECVVFQNSLGVSVATVG
jgi:hypothetical protein